MRYCITHRPLPSLASLNLQYHRHRFYRILCSLPFPRYRILLAILLTGYSILRRILSSGYCIRSPSHRGTTPHLLPPFSTLSLSRLRFLDRSSIWSRSSRFRFASGSSEGRLDSLRVFLLLSFLFVTRRALPSAFPSQDRGLLLLLFFL
ncbi:hypothetical protein PENTCL1PPCAC_27739, partial [Pristionchus entomophagus]